MRFNYILMHQIFCAVYFDTTDCLLVLWLMCRLACSLVTCSIKYGLDQLHIPRKLSHYSAETEPLLLDILLMYYIYKTRADSSYCPNKLQYFLCLNLNSAYFLKVYLKRKYCKLLFNLQRLTN